jgi:GNAT superfamily N-acetyltransferase
MLEIVAAQSETQIQQVRELSRDYIRWLIDLEKAHGMYDPQLYRTYGYDSGEVPLPGEFVAPDGCLLLALDDEMPAGCIGLVRENPDLCEMRMLYVREASQGRGIGKALITALLDQGKKMGCKSMRLDTTKVLTSAVRLYQALGFEEIAPYHDYQNVPKELQLFMSKELV